jgi:hypothetical protein
MDISFIFYGLQSMKGNEEGLKSILTTMEKVRLRVRASLSLSLSLLLKVTTALVEKRDSPSAQDICMMMNGLQSNR